MKKIDYKKDFKTYFAPSAKEPVILTIPKFSFLTIDGQGAPEGAAFQQAVRAVYAAHFTIKFTLKFAKVGPDYTTPPLEALWWTTGGKKFDMNKRNQWLWRVMLMQPPHITKRHLTVALSQIREKAKKKKETPNPALGMIALTSFAEGLCVQIMHIGPYAQERPTIDTMHAFAKKQGYGIMGKHHEIYLGDPRKTMPDKLRTVLRQPIKKQ